MTPTVREFRTADAEAVAEVRRAAVPYLVCTAAAVAWQNASAPTAQRLRWLVAEDPADGSIVGCVDTAVQGEGAEGPGDTAPAPAPAPVPAPAPAHGFLHTAVHPRARGRGVGDALVRAAEAHLAGLRVRTAYTWVADDGGSPRFAERRGYGRSRRARFLGLDLSRAQLPPLPDPLPPGVELRTARDFAGDLRPLYEADLECAADEPGDVQAGYVPYEDWLRLNWHRPDWDAHLTTVALVVGEVAAYSVAQTDGHSRYWSGMTGTRRAYRGRGLATLAKLDSLRRSRAAGYAHAFTGNDAENAPMLAVNKRLGYEPAGAEWRYAKALTPLTAP